MTESDIVRPICPKCFQPNGLVEGAWICFTRWEDCGINSMSYYELWQEFGPRLQRILALVLDHDTWTTYSKEVIKGMILKAAGDTRWEWP